MQAHLDVICGAAELEEFLLWSLPVLNQIIRTKKKTKIIEGYCSIAYNPSYDPDQQH